MTIEEAQKIIEVLEPKLTAERVEKIQRVICNRTKSIVPVLENIYDTGNINASMRSAEAFGCRDFHIIESISDAKYYKGKRTSSGANKWLSIHKWKSPAEGIAYLKDQGFSIAATAIKDAQPIHEIDFNTPTAIIFGNEKAGVSEEILQAADKRVFIPMDGFVESFNISVACALSLYTARLQRGTKHADLTDDEKLILTAQYYRKTLPKQS